MPVSELSFLPSTQNLASLATIINGIAEAAAHIDSAHLASLVHLSDTNPDLADITMTWLFNGPGDLHFISWAQIDVYGLDFGGTIGKPQFMRSAFMKLDGVVTFLPRKRVGLGEEEEMQVSVMLRDEDMKRLETHSAWRSWLVD